jgi:YaiO family outer membrane protein
MNRTTRFALRCVPLLMATTIPLVAATLEEGLALKRAQDFPGAARIFNELVSANPKDVDALEQLATVTGWMERHAEALALWDRAIVLAPQYDGLRLNRARVLYWMGRLPEAEAAITEVLPRMAQDADAWELAGDIARARHDVVRARERYRQAIMLAPMSTAVRKEAQLVMPKRWRLDAGGMVDDYETKPDAPVQRDLEQTAYVQLGFQISDVLTIAGGADYAHQFGQVDWRYNVEAYWSADAEWSFQVRVAITPDAEILANWEALLATEWNPLIGVAPLLAVRTADYSDERIVTYMPGVRVGEQFTAEARLYYTTSDVNDSTMAGVLRFGATIAERWQPYILGSYGEENQPPVGVAITASAAAGTVVQINDALSLRFDALYEWREDIHERASLGGGFTLRF